MKKIVAIGPESTGKSWLCEELSKHYQTSWCPEYAREYLLQHGKKYNYEDLLTIAKGQLNLETITTQSAIQNQKSKIFLDTDMYVLKVWCEFVFKKCHRFILDEIVKREYDLYLLCNIDLPWVADELREYPDLKPRRQLYQMYKDILVNQSTPWVDISGEHSNRLKTAIDAVDKL